MRIDAHQHFWRFDPVRDAWITLEMETIRRDFLPHDLAPLLEHSGIDGVVAVQADQSLAETDFLLALAREHSFVRGVVGWIDLRSLALRETLARYRDNSALKGFRHIAQAEPDDFLAQSDVVSGVRTLGAHGYSYDILIKPPQLAAASQLVRACPDVTFVLDHCAKPDIASGKFSDWRTGLRALAQHPNVYCKVSGLVTEAAWATWHPEEIIPVMEWALACFGAERLMFGSDWPVCLLAGQYARVHEVVRDWAGSLSDAEQRALFGDTASRAYRLASAT